jgi:hypothetical protein
MRASVETRRIPGAQGERLNDVCAAPDAAVHKHLHLHDAQQ